MISSIARWLPSVVLVFALSARFGFAAGAAANPNIFSNPSFEQGRDAWNCARGGKTVARFAVDTAEAAAGQSSALVTIEAVDGWGVQFGQNVEAGAKGRTYTFAVVAKGVKDPVVVRLEIERSANPWDRAARSEPIKLAKDSWTEHHITFTVEKPFPEGWFAYVSCEQPHAEFRIDAFRLYEGEYVPYKEAAQEELAAASVALFDTASPARAPWSAEELARRAGWIQVPEGKTDHAFAGDAVVMNDRVALAARRGAPGAELYGRAARGHVLRAALAPAAAWPNRTIDAVTIAKNGPDAAALDVRFGTAGDGAKVELRFELEMGQPFVATSGRSLDAAALRVEAPCRWAVLPDFFADDIVIDPREIPVPSAELPNENFLLRLLGGGEAILMTVASKRDDDVRISLAGEGNEQRMLAATEIPFGPDGTIWVSPLEGRSLWHVRDVAARQAGEIVRLEWTMPFPAQWRVDWRKADTLTDSWEMLLEKPNGEFEKAGTFGSPQTIPANRRRWTTVLGTFTYPCWADRSGQAFLQPLKNDAVRFEGPALVYPINRVRATPLDAFTVADIARATLGVGPCEYILDVEGQGQVYKGRATCATRDALRDIYSKKQQKAKRAEIEKILDEVMLFVKHIRARIDEYVAFGHWTIAYVKEQEKAHPELRPFVDEMARLARTIDSYLVKRKAEVRTPAYVAELAEKFRATLLDDVSDGALPQVVKITEAIVDVGGNQDELVGECRMVVKIIRQRAGLAMALDRRTAEAAKEIRRRAHEALRNPAGHEGASH